MNTWQRMKPLPQLSDSSRYLSLRLSMHAKSEKSWISDPDGVVWEAFYTKGEATVYGDSPTLGAVSANASNDTCCAPAIPAAPACTASCG